MGLFFRMDAAWPEVFRNIFIVFTVPFSFNFTVVHAQYSFVFYLKMLVPFVLFYAYTSVGTRPYLLKAAFTHDMARAQYTAFVYCLGSGMVLGLAATNIDFHEKIGEAVGIALLSAAFLLIVWFSFCLYFSRSLSRCLNEKDELNFFCGFRANVRTAALLLMFLAYLPLGQAILEMLLKELTGRGEVPEAEGLAKVANVGFATGFLILYLIYFPLWLLKNLRATRNEAASSTQWERTDRTSDQDKEMTTIVSSHSVSSTSSLLQSNVKSNFLQEGKQVSLQLSILRMMKKKNNLRDDASRRAMVEKKLVIHRQNERVAFAQALNSYTAKRGGDCFMRQTLAYDAGFYFWKFVLLVEKGLLLAVVSFALVISCKDTDEDECGSDHLAAPIAATLAVTIAFFAYATFAKPFLDHIRVTGNMYSGFLLSKEEAAKVQAAKAAGESGKGADGATKKNVARVSILNAKEVDNPLTTGKGDEEQEGRDEEQEGRVAKLEAAGVAKLEAADKVVGSVAGSGEDRMDIVARFVTLVNLTCALILVMVKKNGNIKTTEAIVSVFLIILNVLNLIFQCYAADVIGLIKSAIRSVKDVPAALRRELENKKASHEAASLQLYNAAGDSDTPNAVKDILRGGLAIVDCK
jgi:hypothetical protein